MDQEKIKGCFQNWIFTVFNYDDACIAAIKALSFRYILFGEEVCPTTKREHLQGYISFDTKKSLRQMLKMFPVHPRLCNAKGSPADNKVYCSKEDKNFYEAGVAPLWDPVAKGTLEKDRWAEAFKAVEEGRIEDVPSDMKCKHLKSIEYAVKRQKMCHRNLEIIDGPLEHLWYVGETGCGKTSQAKAEHPLAYIKDPTTAWWDGYSGQEVVIIDDFDKFQVKQGGDMKRWLDRYPFQAQFKGGYELMRPRLIIVTSQYTPSEIWDDQKTVEAINRRVKVVRICPGPFSRTYNERSGSGVSPPAASAPGEGPVSNSTLATSPTTPTRLEFMNANGW